MCFYLIIPMPGTLGARWAGAGTRLVKKTKLQVHLFDNKDDVDPKDKWQVYLILLVQLKLIMYI